MSPVSIIDHPSPNHDERQSKVEMIVLHYTGMQSGQEAIDRLCDPVAKVSAHYVIEEDGRIFRLVPEENRAWHAGVSHWRGRDGVNDVSVGIEIVNPGHEWGYRSFPEAQMASVQKLVEGIIGRWQIPVTGVVGHSDVAPERKEDPGELFPWDRLAEAGFTIGPVDPAAITNTPVPDYMACLTLLREIGYGLKDNNHAAPVLAFQRRFLPSALGQGLDRQTRQAIAAIHEKFAKA